MVTRLYSPVYPKPGRSTVYTKHQSATPQSVQEEAIAPPAPLSATVSNEANTPSTTNPDGRSRYEHLATIQDQQRGKKIQLDSVLADFQQTMLALNTTPETASKLDAYLNVVHIQGQESQPNVGLIKNTLLTAGKTLDQFIESSVGQPSTVVHDWVKALIAQDIEYKTQNQWRPHPASINLQTESRNTAVTASPWTLVRSSDPELSMAEKQRLQQWIQAAKTQPADRAIPLLSQALMGLEGKNRPDLESKIHTLLGHRYWQTNHLSEAIPAFHAAIQTAPTLEKQQRLSLDLGHLLLKQGHLDDAFKHLSTGLTDPQTVKLYHPTLQIRAYQDYGQVLQKTGQAEQAVSAYRQALQIATQAKRRHAFREILPELATSYLSLNQPEHALRMLQRYQQMTTATTSVSHTMAAS